MAHNYAAYSTGGRSQQMGILDLEKGVIRKLAYKSGAPVSSLYEVIEAGPDAFETLGDSLELSAVKLLAPISDRDVLAVGKNYVDHAKEFSQSGYDSSDKAEQPSHPVIFTKRATSIIAHGDDIYPHVGFTESVDYEGEIGVIVGKAGFQVSEADADDYVWGYTIVNDMTARERQRDHKQFYIGKSPDTFCPMGPVAVPKEDLTFPLSIQTFVNGEKRQDADSSMLIFSVASLIATISRGATIRPGDVVATGTPAGVGFGFRPMKFLHPGDEISVRVSGLGTLTNKIAAADSRNATADALCAAAAATQSSLSGSSSSSSIPWRNTRALDAANPGLVDVSGKRLFHRSLGADGAPDVAFIHGLGGMSEYFAPALAGLHTSRKLHLMDIEGHGLSPTSVNSVTSIESYADDAANLLRVKGVTRVAVVAHSMGCLVAVQLALKHPDLVERLVLMGPPPSPLPDAAVQSTLARAAAVREGGMLSVADALAVAALSDKTKTTNGLAVAALRLSVMGQSPEGYAKACRALALAPALDFPGISCPALLLTGSEDKVSPPSVCEKYAEAMAKSRLQVLENVGHWHLFEDASQVSLLVDKFLTE